MLSSSGVGNGTRGRGIVRRCGGHGRRAGLGGRGGVLEDLLLLLQDCTFTARLPYQWLIQDV
jgi:hypothetical protein